MRIGRKTAALALPVVATLANGAQAGPSDPGTGAGTAIKDWFSVTRQIGQGHDATALCEYALNPGTRSGTSNWA